MPAVMPLLISVRIDEIQTVAPAPDMRNNGRRSVDCRRIAETAMIAA
ncbi:hypothetical protein [Paracoccus sp. ME4]